MDITNLKILITGANGQLGYDLRRLLTGLKCDFVATDYQELDITNKFAVSEFIISGGFDIVINCAAYNEVDKAEDDVENCYKLNCYAPYYLAKASKEIGAVFITYSTDFVFDGKKGEPYTENDKPNPISTYGKSKYEGEESVLKEYENSIIIRTSWLFGINGKNFNTQVINWAKSRNELKIVDDQISSPTYSYDLADFTLKLLKKDVYGLFHFSNSGIASKYDQAKYLLEKIKWKGALLRAKSSEFSLKAQRPAFSKLDSEKIEGITSSKILSWQSGLDRWWEEYSAV